MQLTKEIRAKIIDAAIANSEIPKRRAKTQSDLKKLGKLAHSLAVEIPVAIQSLPDNVKKLWLRHDSRVEVEAEGFYRYGAFPNEKYRQYLPAGIQLDDPVLSPQFLGTVRSKDFPKLKSECAKVSTYHLETNSKEDALRSKLSAIVYSANTSDQLLKTWPEGKKFLPPAPVKTRALVDTKTVAEVNTELGLP